MRRVAKSDDDRPDIAIEVVWTSGGIDKLEVYRKLGMREVWFYSPACRNPTRPRPSARSARR